MTKAEPEIPLGARAARRWPWLVALALVIALGLWSRRHPLPGVLAEHTGDALYCTAAYCAFGWLWPGLPPRRLAVLAWCFSALVELSQLLRWQWLVDLRAAPPWSLLLGQGWQWADLLAYLFGALLAAVGDTALRRSRRPPNNSGRVGPAA